MTLDEMIQQCAADTDEAPLPKSNDAYAGDSKVIADKFTVGINFAYRKIAKEKIQLTHSEAVTLDAKKSFLATALSRELITILSIETADESPIGWNRGVGNKIICPGAEAGGSVTVEYRYLPAKLALLTAVPDFPEGQVDHRILCYYADFEYLNTEVDAASRNRAQTWLGLFNSGYSDINPNIGELTAWRIE